jgi:hypothetical protein
MFCYFDHSHLPKRFFYGEAPQIVHALLLTERWFLCWEAKISYLEDPLLLKLKTTIQIERRVVMCKKILIPLLSIALLLVISAPITPVNAGGKRLPINWQVAGSIINEVMTSGTPSGQTLILLKAQGAPGPADLTILGYIGIPGSILVDGCNFAIPFDGDEFVAVFSDLSMLFAKLEVGGDAYVCVDPQPSTFKFDMEIFGGTGRFDGATGKFTATGVGPGEGFDGPLSAESGEFIGTIEFPD